MQYWVRKGLLARSTRPGYTAGSEHLVTREAVDTWVQSARRHKIASIICILGEDQLPLYNRALPGGLIEHYREAGFEVAHISVYDGRTNPLSEQDLNYIWESFRRLPKPVLVHCSAGHDRTGIAINHITARLAEEADAGDA
jgi:protein tyrosine/serine phosphatase